MAMPLGSLVFQTIWSRVEDDDLDDVSDNLLSGDVRMRCFFVETVGSSTLACRLTEVVGDVKASTGASKINFTRRKILIANFNHIMMMANVVNAEDVMERDLCLLFILLQVGQRLELKRELELDRSQLLRLWNGSVLLMMMAVGGELLMLSACDGYDGMP